MTHEPVAVPGPMTVSEFLATAPNAGASFPVIVDGGDTVTGPPSFNQIDHVRAGQRDHTRLADIACPLTESPRRGLTTRWPIFYLVLPSAPSAACSCSATGT